MSKAILLSIHPKWAQKIYSGEKTVEWRKTFPKGYSGIVFLYETAPVKKVTGFVIVAGFVGLNMNEYGIFTYAEAMIRRGCVDEESLRKYQGHSGHVIGWLISKSDKYTEPMSLETFGLKRAPQSWQYVEVNNG